MLVNHLDRDMKTNLILNYLTAILIVVIGWGCKEQVYETVYKDGPYKITMGIFNDNDIDGVYTQASYKGNSLGVHVRPIIEKTTESIYDTTVVPTVKEQLDTIYIGHDWFTLSSSSGSIPSSFGRRINDSTYVHYKGEKLISTDTIDCAEVLAVLDEAKGDIQKHKNMLIREDSIKRVHDAEVKRIMDCVK